MYSYASEDEFNGQYDRTKRAIYMGRGLGQNGGCCSDDYTRSETGCPCWWDKGGGEDCACCKEDMVQCDQANKKRCVPKGKGFLCSLAPGQTMAPQQRQAPRMTAARLQRMRMRARLRAKRSYDLLHPAALQEPQTGTQRVQQPPAIVAGTASEGRDNEELMPSLASLSEPAAAASTAAVEPFRGEAEAAAVKLFRLSVRKTAAIAREDYDAAKMIKKEMDAIGNNGSPPAEGHHGTDSL
jgi:hypothetical protein